MAIAFVSSVSAAPGANGGATGTFDTTGASLIVVLTSCANAAASPTVSDNKGNTYTSLAEAVPGSVSRQVHYCFLPSVGSGHTVTVATVTNIKPAILAYAFSGVYGYAGIQNIGSNNSVGPVSCGTVVPTENGSLIFVVCAGDTVACVDTEPAGFTGKLTVQYNSSTNFQGSAAYLIQATAASITPSWTFTGGARFTSAQAIVFEPTSTAIGRVSQLPVEVGILSDAPITARVSQLPTEIAILSDASITARLSQLPIEILINTSIIPLPSPIAYWAFNEGTGTTIADLTGNGHTATLVNGTWNPAFKAFGVSALANTDVSRAASISSFNIGTVNSIAFWMNGWDGSNDGIVIGGPGSGNGSFACYINSADFGYSTDGSVYNSKAHGTLTGLHHVVITRNGTTVTWYVDGVSLGSTTLSNNTACTIDSIGAVNGATKTPFVGTIDEVRLYDATLTAANVTELYNLAVDTPTLARVQIKQATAGLSASIAVTFDSIPTLGNGIVVCACNLSDYSATGVTGVTDNQGNTYTLAKQDTGGGATVYVYYCAKVLTTGSPFIVTASGSGSIYRSIQITELNSEIGVDQSASSNGVDVSSSIGPLTALTGSEAFLISCLSLTANTNGHSPYDGGWNLYTLAANISPVTAAVATRIVDFSTGMTPRIGWTHSGASSYSNALVAFKPVTSVASTETTQFLIVMP